MLCFEPPPWWIHHCWIDTKSLFDLPNHDGRIGFVVLATGIVTAISVSLMKGATVTGFAVAVVLIAHSWTQKARWRFRMVSTSFAAKSLLWHQRLHIKVSHCKCRKFHTASVETAVWFEWCGLAPRFSNPQLNGTWIPTTIAREFATGKRSWRHGMRWGYQTLGNGLPEISESAQLH